MTASPPGGRAVFDPGLQPERTALAWRRTSLSLLVCSVAGTRLLGPALGWWALLVGAAGAGTAAWVSVLARRRCGRGTDHLLGRAGTGALPDGLQLALTAGLVLAGGVLGTGYVVSRAL